MEEQFNHDWVACNQVFLAAALADIKATLSRHVDRGTSAGSEDAAAEIVPEAASGPASLPGEAAAIEMLCAAFNLSRFERSILLLCAGIELDSTVAPLCAAAQGNPQRSYPTFSLALAAFAGAHWSALTPEGPLRRWRLITPGSGSVLTLVPLQIEERVLHFLTGISQLDDRLATMVDVAAPVRLTDLSPSHTAVAETLMSAWRGAGPAQPRGAAQPPVAVQLCGQDAMESRAIAAAAATAAHLRCFVLATDLLPTAPADFDQFLRLWERDNILSPAVLIIECEADGLSGDNTWARTTARLIERLDSLIVICSRESRRIANRPSITLHVVRPTNAEQRSAWRNVLPHIKDHRPIERLASQFSMSLPEIRSVAIEVVSRTYASEQDVAAAAWQACRAKSRSKLDGLAQRIEPAAQWDDLVLPAPQVGLLRQLAMHVRQRTTVFDTWGFGHKSSRGKGISALFAGASGTGKTMAAEVLAGELRLDLYRVDLSAVVSKYIGETEKNLRRVFDAAEQDGAILLFDEADALFGKRSEVKDSHDRYSNIEVSYLLQRMEEYRGLAVLTTNMKNALDTAFLRRIRFVVNFPFPDAAQRAEIWRRIFPSGTPTDGIEVTKLSRLNVAGGNIRNVALSAAFLAADAGEPVRMSHLLRATRTEYAKLEKSLTDAESGIWL